jgi:hypothetical protein
MRPVRNVFQKLSRTEQRREGVVAYLCFKLLRGPRIDSKVSIPPAWRAGTTTLFLLNS